MKNVFCNAFNSSMACADADASSACALLSLIADAIIMASVSVYSVIVRVISLIIRISILDRYNAARSSA